MGLEKDVYPQITHQSPYCYVQQVEAVATLHCLRRVTQNRENTKQCEKRRDNSIQVICADMRLNGRGSKHVGHLIVKLK